MPALRTDHAIVYATGTPQNRRSAVTLAGGHAIVPASVLLAGVLTAKVGKRLTAALLNGLLVDARDNSWLALRALTMRVVQKSAGVLCNTEAIVRFVFNCGNITDSIVGLLDGFEPGAADWRCSNKSSPRGEFTLGQCELSAFVVLEMLRPSEVADQSLERMFETLASREKSSRVLPMRPVQILDRVASVTTPFTNEVFFKSIHMGSVANVFGTNDCLFVVSQALVAGCDGGAVYNERLEIVGIIIGTTFRWKGTENATMTLVASFAEIVDEFLRQSMMCGSLRVQRAITTGQQHSLAKSVLLIEVGSSSGSGFFARVNGERFIITCAHVVANAESHTAITCTWSGGTFATSILYRNPHLGSAYDVALLHVPDGIRVPDAAFARCAPANTTTIGQRVFATGFPHFYALAKVQFAPSVLEGRITKVGEHMLQTDASIQAGQSGGPLLNADGDVVAVMVSNTRESSALGRIHPHVNMCIPMGAIVEILAEYAECKDTLVLDRMQASKEVSRLWNLQPDLVISRL